MNELLGIVPPRDTTLFRPPHMHVLTSAIWDVRNQVQHQNLKPTSVASAILAVFIESWLYVRKTDLSNKPRKAGLHKRKRDNGDVKRDTPPNNNGKEHAKADPPPDSEPTEGSSTLAFIDGSCMRPGKPDARAGYGIVFPHREDILMCFANLKVLPKPTTERNLLPLLMLTVSLTKHSIRRRNLRRSSIPTACS